MDPVQEEVARVALAAAAAHGFVLAGGNAIAQHGIGHRLTQDVDLFTNDDDPEGFRAAVEAAAAALHDHGWQCDVSVLGGTFARISAVCGEQSVAIDMGLDNRAHPPTVMDVGPVLSLLDAAGSKMATLYSRDTTTRTETHPGYRLPRARHAPSMSRNASSSAPP